MINAGAKMQQSLQAMPHSGLALLTRVMAVASLGAAGIVALYALVTILLGTISLMAVPWHWTIGENSTGKQVTYAQVSVSQVTTSPLIEKQLDTDCPELKKATGGDISKCAWLPHTPSIEELGAASKAKQTVGNWFNAAIRPVFWSVPVFILVIGLIEAARCLNGLAAGRYFSAGTVAYLRNFAIAGLLYVLLTPCMPSLANGFCNAVVWVESLYIRALPPHHPYAISMPSYFEANAVIGGVKKFSGFLIVLYAFTLVVIAIVMAKASAIIDDHAGII
jgi:hypothetical protein